MTAQREAVEAAAQAVCAIDCHCRECSEAGRCVLGAAADDQERAVAAIRAFLAKVEVTISARQAALNASRAQGRAFGGAPALPECYEYAAADLVFRAMLAQLKKEIGG